MCSSGYILSRTDILVIRINYQMPDITCMMLDITLFDIDGMDYSVFDIMHRRELLSCFFSYIYCLIVELCKESSAAYKKKKGLSHWPFFFYVLYIERYRKKIGKSVRLLLFRRSFRLAVPCSIRPCTRPFSVRRRQRAARPSSVRPRLPPLSPVGSYSGASPR